MAASAVHFQLPVSFFIVKQVVEHGQWKSENIIVHIAVFIVHPLLISTIFNSAKSFISIILPVDMYAIKIIGTTISLAGNPKINAISITPSSPSMHAKGSSAEVQ